MSSRRAEHREVAAHVADDVQRAALPAQARRQRVEDDDERRRRRAATISAQT